MFGYLQGGKGCEGRNWEVPFAVPGPAGNPDLALDAASEVKGVTRHKRAALAQQHAQGIATAPPTQVGGSGLADTPLHCHPFSAAHALLGAKQRWSDYTAWHM